MATRNRMPRPLTLRTGEPVWLPPRVAQRARRYPPLTGIQRADVVIVGGGITGAITALRFAEAGVETILVEADRIGQGSTAASSALLLQEPDARLTALAERAGTATARRIWRLSHDAAHELIALLDGLAGRTGLTRRATVYYTTNLDEVAPLHAECLARRRAGFAATWLSAGALRVETGIPGRAGIRTEGNAHCDPFQACAAVMHAAIRAGARVFERSAVRRIDRRDGGLRIRAGAGVVEARQVVIATGYATSRFKPLAGRFQMSHTYVVATPPLSAAERRELGLADLLLWDTRRRYYYARWTRDHRLLLGGADRPIRPGGRPAAVRLAAGVERIRAHFERLLPGLADLPLAHAWEGRFANTPDSLPYIGPHHRYPRHAFALGYGGNGMTFAPLAARLLVEQWRGVTSRDHALFGFARD
jgi:glycine/D-amino acid oxidase-like deaminating enzyme